MVKKILEVAFPFIMWNNSKGVFKKLTIFLSTFISIWIYGSIILYIFMVTTYKKTHYSQLSFYHTDLNYIGKNYLKKESERQLSFLVNDNLNQNIPDIKVFFVNNKLFFNWLLGPINVFNKINNTETGAITPVHAKIIFLNYSLTKEHEEKDLVLSHELVHILQHEKYGYLSSRLHTPLWVSEGYATLRMAEYSGNKIDSLKVTDQLANWGNLLRHAIDSMSINLDELHKGKVEYKDVLSSMCKKHPSYWGCKNI